MNTNKKAIRSDKGSVKVPLSSHLVAADWDHEMNPEPIEKFGTGSSYRAYWLCAKCGHKWQALVFHRANGTGCAACAKLKRRGPRKVLSEHAPDVAKEWDYGKNSDTPDDVGTGLRKKRWWLCSECSHSWNSVVAMRVFGQGCPECAITAKMGTRRPISGHPFLSSEWSERNLIKPEQVGQGDSYKAHWICSICSYEWQAAVYKRVEGRGCPGCFSKRMSEPKKLLRDHPVAEDFNDDPELLSTVGVSNTTRVNWKCSSCGHKWKVGVRDRTLVGSGCPACNKPGWNLDKLRAWLASNQEILLLTSSEQEDIFRGMGILVSLAPARSVVAGIMSKKFSEEDILHWATSGKNEAIQKAIDNHRADHYGGKKGISPFLRNKVFARDGNSCLACGSKKKLSVDHIIPESKGGDTVLENLQLLCMTCNLKKSTKLISLEELRELVKGSK